MTPPWPLSCPACRTPMEVTPEGLTCTSGHRFDMARQGYVNLLSGRGTRFTPDTAQMIMARERVQAAGVFSSLSEHLLTLLSASPLPVTDGDVDSTSTGFGSADSAPLILDCGAGTGHYLDQLLEAHPHSLGVALDLSTAGLKRAARHPRVLALAWDLWQRLPLRDHCADLLLDIFAPRNVAEYARVLRPGGAAVVVTPREEHLAQLRKAGLLGMQGQKLRQLLEQMEPAFGPPESTHRVHAEVHVDPALAADLVFMGPAGHHAELDQLRAEAARREVSEVTIDLDVSQWRR